MGGRGVLRRNYTGKKPVVIQHRTPDAANYYDHENVSKCAKTLHIMTSKRKKKKHKQTNYDSSREKQKYNCRGNNKKKRENMTNSDKIINTLS